MRSRLLWLACFMVIEGGTLSAQLLPPVSDEVKLRVTQQEFDEDAAGRGEPSHAEALAKQFKVAPSLVESLRVEKAGWGEIATRLGFAQELTKTKSTTYRTVPDALHKVGELRGQKRSWAELGQDLGLDLAPVVGELQRVRQDMKAQAKKAATDGTVTPHQMLKETETAAPSQKSKKSNTSKSGSQ